LDVIDTGCGIPADRIAAIFEAFEQADSTTTRQYGGTGLGLTITRALARLMGCAIDVKSEVGIGSTFSLLLVPRTAPPAQGEAIEVPPAVRQRTTQPLRRLHDVELEEMFV